VSGVDELVAFVRRCLDEDERVALEAIPGPWEARWWGVQTAYNLDRPGYIHHGERVGIANNSGTVGNREAEVRNVEHIARWDPFRALEEVKTKRERLLWIEGELADDDTQETVQWLAKLEAQPYAGQDGWREEWRA
jgi:hypothetical protein